MKETSVMLSVMDRIVCNVLSVECHIVYIPKNMILIVCHECLFIEIKCDQVQYIITLTPLLNESLLDTKFLN
jgi:hypothetical protein